MQPGTRAHFLEHLARDWPQEAERYARLYRRPSLDRAVSEPIKRQVAALARAAGIADRRVEPCEPAPALEQLPLAI